MRYSLKAPQQIVHLLHCSQVLHVCSSAIALSMLVSYKNRKFYRKLVTADFAKYSIKTKYKAELVEYRIQRQD